MPYYSGTGVLVILNHSPDYFLSYTPLSPITITHNYSLLIIDGSLSHKVALQNFIRMLFYKLNVDL